MRKWIQHHQKKLLLIGPPVALVIIVFLFAVFTGRYQSTHDAYTKAAKISVNANVSGQVTSMAVHENQWVKKGMLLFKLDDRPYLNQVKKTKASWIESRFVVTALKSSYQQQLISLNAAQEIVQEQTKELKRQEKLAANGISSLTFLDKQKIAYHAALQQLAAAKQKQEKILALLNSNPNAAVEDHVLVKKAKAEYDQALLNLSYTVIRAPNDGIATKVEQLQVGDYVTTGAPLFAIVSKKDIWVEANFKETKLTYMAPGQNVTIRLDTYPHQQWKGHIASLSPGTGSTFALLPPENATGNWVKIVQRLPVRIAIDNLPPNVNFFSGLSATVSVDTGKNNLTRWFHRVYRRG